MSLFETNMSVSPKKQMRFGRRTILVARPTGGDAAQSPQLNKSSCVSTFLSRRFEQIL
jgi:hypothetical protein